MCNHYRLDARDIRLFRDWEALDWPGAALEQGKLDIWPRSAAPVLRLIEGEIAIDVMRWGFPTTVPGKREGSRVKRDVTNVRHLDKPFWKSTLTQPEHRCLVPFSSFAEPRGIKDPTTGRPGEYWFSVKTAPIAAFAGIWRPSTEGNAFGFLTCEPNALVAPLHPKAMPVILDPGDYGRWLTTGYADACSMATPFPSQLMDVV